MNVAPWQVHLCLLRADDEAARAAADALHESLRRLGVEVLYDDRVVSAGVMFSDADLMGVPLRVIVSPRGLKDKQVEITRRDKTANIKTPLHDAAAYIKNMIDHWDEA
jgi:prolyl-tRNA synthetase